jgi:zinc protease
MMLPSSLPNAPIVASPVAGTAAPSKAQQQLARITTHQLSNGITLVHNPMVGVPRLALSVYIKGGNLLDETPGQTDVIDRLLTKGTSTHNSQQVAQALDELSLDLGTSTRRDTSVLGGTLLAEDLNASLTWLANLVLDASLKEQGKEVERMKGELAMELDAPKARAADNLVRGLFANSPYGTTASVLQKHLEELAKPLPLRNLYERAYRTDRCLISLTGEVNLQQVIDHIETVFTKHRPSTAAAGSSALPAILRQRTLTSDVLLTAPRDDANQAHIYRAWLTPPITHPDYEPLMVLNTLLGAGGLSSRLFLELRDKQGLAYNVRSSLEGYQHRGSFTLYIGTEPSNVQKCLAGFQQEIDKLLNVPVSDDELAATKANLLGRRAIQLETAGQWCGYVGNALVLGRTLADLAGTTDRLQAVTSGDIQRVAQTYLSQPSVVSIVGPSGCLP